MIGRRFEDITAEDVCGLISNAVPEGRTIEYKRTLPGHGDDNKKEFLADVSSFANSAGGDILYGVEAKSGVPIRVVGLQDLDADKETLRIESIIQDGLDPRIPGFRVRVVSVPDHGPVLLIRVLKSWSGPHMVTFKGTSKFYSRSGARRFKMDTDELRSAFSLAADLPARIRAWRDDRLAKIISGDTPVPVADSAKMVLHLVPLDSFNLQNRVPATVLDSKWNEFRPMDIASRDNRLNLDGLLTYGRRAHEERMNLGYCQVFRSGQVESVRAELVRNGDDHRVIASIAYEKRLLESTARYLRALEAIDVHPPFLIMVAFIGVREATMGVDARYCGDLHPIDRNVLVLPDVLIDEAPQDLPGAMRPIFDAAWNACGAPRSANYDDNGRWIADALDSVP